MRSAPGLGHVIKRRHENIVRSGIDRRGIDHDIARRLIGLQPGV